MKVLVTGGAGFIGSHLTDLLVAQGHQVVVIDDLSGGRLANIQAHIDSGAITFVEHDITVAEGLAPHFAGVDGVCHLAAKADIVPSIENPELYYRTNVTGTFNVLQAAKQHNVKRFVYAASSSCYGVPEVYPTKESAPIDARYPYALTKYLGEELVLHWGKVYQLPVLSLRFFNVYGPRVRTSGTYGAVFGVFLAQKANGQPYTVVGDGEQTRDFTYVTDVAAAVLTALVSDQQQQVFNVGSGDHYSVNRLVQLLGGDVVYIPKRPGEPDCTFADTTAIREVLEWQPQVSFEDGVANMLHQLKLWKDAPLWNAESIKEETKLWFSHLS